MPAHHQVQEWWRYVQSVSTTLDGNVWSLRVRVSSLEINRLLTLTQGGQCPCTINSCRGKRTGGRRLRSLIQKGHRRWLIYRWLQLRGRPLMGLGTMQLPCSCCVLTDMTETHAMSLMLSPAYVYLIQNYSHAHAVCLQTQWRFMPRPWCYLFSSVRSGYSKLFSHSRCLLTGPRCYLFSSVRLLYSELFSRWRCSLTGPQCYLFSSVRLPYSKLFSRWRCLLTGPRCYLFSSVCLLYSKLFLCSRYLLTDTTETYAPSSMLSILQRMFMLFKTILTLTLFADRHNGDLCHVTMVWLWLQSLLG
jgi:hypothetical protein